MKRAILVMANQEATRNKPITRKLKRRLIAAVTAVYGADVRIEVYSGGQDKKGQGKRRTGSVRHDDYGSGGRAADCYIYVSGRKISGVELARLGQYWLAKKLGAVGLEMNAGGIHLDEWTTPPRGGGMFWTYDYSNQKSWGKKVREMLVSGSRGHFPEIEAPSYETAIIDDPSPGTRAHLEQSMDIAEAKAVLRQRGSRTIKSGDMLEKISAAGGTATAVVYSASEFTDALEMLPDWLWPLPGWALGLIVLAVFIAVFWYARSILMARAQDHISGAHQGRPENPNEFEGENV